MIANEDCYLWWVVPLIYNIEIKSKLVACSKNKLMAKGKAL